MRARHNSCRYGAVIDDSPWAWRWASLATWRRRFDGWAILETLNQQVFLGKPGILEGGTVTCNGDIGYLRDVEPDDRELIAIFDGRELDTLVPAYAATIHKSRGSEYPAVVIPVMTQHDTMLQRSLLYTGQKKAVGIAVGNISGRRRWSKLSERLQCAEAGIVLFLKRDGKSIDA